MYIQPTPIQPTWRAVQADAIPTEASVRQKASAPHTL